MATPLKQPTAPYNPFFGCAILIMIVTVFVGIITWSYYSFSTQDKAIGEFTVDSAVPLTPVKVPEAEVEPLKSVMRDFAEGVTAGKTGALELSIAEINTLLAIAPDTGYGDFTQMVAFKSTNVANQTLQADVCLPMNKMKFWEGKRYAVGEASFKPDIVKDAGADMKLVELTVPGKPVDPKFNEALAGWYWLTPYQKLESLTPVFKAINKVEVTATGIKISVEKTTP